MASPKPSEGIGRTPCALWLCEKRAARRLPQPAAPDTVGLGPIVASGARAGEVDFSSSALLGSLRPVQPKNQCRQRRQIEHQRGRLAVPRAELGGRQRWPSAKLEPP